MSDGNSNANVLIRLGTILGMLLRMTPQEIEDAISRPGLSEVYRKHLVKLLQLRRQLQPIGEEVASEPG